MYDTDAIDEDTEQIFKASDVKAASGLTYRQLNDWEERGALPESKDRGSKWRRYSMLDLFIIVVLAELKTQFNTPIEKLKFVKGHIEKRGVSRLNALIFQVAGNGISQWLLTDFEKKIVIDSEIEIRDMFDRGDFHSTDQMAYVLLNITPLIQKIGQALVNQEIAFPNVLFNALQARKEMEEEILRHVRNSQIEKVEVLMNDETVKTIKTTRSRDVQTQLKKLLNENDFQTVTITKRDGEIVQIKQTVTHKK